MKKIVGLVVSLFMAIALSGCSPQDGLNRDFSSEESLVAALSQEGFECPIWGKFVASDFGQAGVDQAERHAGLFGWKSRSWCGPQDFDEISIEIFEDANGAEKAAISSNFLCKGSAVNGEFIQVKNWMISTENHAVLGELANLAETQIRTYPECR